MKTSNHQLKENSNQKSDLFNITSLFLILCCILTITSLNAQSIITQSFQPSAANGHDAFVINLTGCSQPSTAGDTNFGNSSELRAMTWTYNSPPNHCDIGYTRTYINFDGLNTIPNNAVITSAELFLYSDPNSANNSINNNPLQIGRVINNWDEQTITWNNKPSADYSNNVTHQGATQTHEDISINVTSIVQSQISSGINNGFSIKLINESTYQRWSWASSDNIDASKHPKLVVKYYLPCDGNFTYCYNTATSIFTFSTNTIEPFTGYYWSFGDGSTANTIGEPVDHTYDSPGNYTVCHDKKDGGCRVCIEICVTTDQIQPTPLPKASKNEESEINKENVSSVQNLFPNPTRGNITLEINSVQISSIAQITIYDLSGKEIYVKQSNLMRGLNKIEIELPKLSSGIYLCRILLDNEQIHSKFVVE